MKILMRILVMLLSTAAIAGTAEKGKKLFTERSCMSCHAVGSEGSAKTGPNLAGVTQRRSKAWLSKWLQNPDTMRTDPVIQKMDSKYHSTMPNLGLSATDVDDLLTYLSAAPGKTGSK